MVIRVLLVAIIVSQFAIVLMLADIGAAIRQQEPAIMDKLAAYHVDLKHLTHPQTVARRTVDWILRQGEFAGVK